MKLIYLEWEDAVASSGQWKTKDDIEEWNKKVSWLVREVGWLYSEDDKYITMVSQYVEGSDAYEENFGLIQKIPKTWIRKRKTIKL